VKSKRIHVSGLVKASMNSNKDVHVLSKEHLAVSLAKYVAELSEKYIQEKGRFTVVLSPGPVKYLRYIVSSFSYHL
jgi:6-phosphogluconolactonase